MARYIQIAAVAALAAAQQPMRPFGGVLSQSTVQRIERQVFAHTLSAGASHGVISHW